ncbi:hypothetical protein LINPERHAP2_LOCUS16660 [Linum perenne]
MRFLIVQITLPSRIFGGSFGGGRAQVGSDTSSGLLPMTGSLLMQKGTEGIWRRRTSARDVEFPQKTHSMLSGTVRWQERFGRSLYHLS